MKLGKPYRSYFDTSSEIRVWDFDFYPSFIPFSTDVFFPSSQPLALKADGTLMPLRFSQIKLHFFIVGKFVEPNETCLTVIF